MRVLKLLPKFIIISIIVLGVGNFCWAAQAPPDPRYETSLSINPTPVVGEQCTLTLSILGLINSPNTHFFIDIPEGVELLNGTVDFYRDIAEEETYNHAVTVRVTEEGKYNFLAIVKSEIFTVNYSDFSLAELHINSTDTSALVFEEVDQTFYITEELDSLDGMLVKRVTPDSGDTYQELEEGVTITVSGTVKYKDKETGTFIPFPHVKVRINNYVTMCCDCPATEPCCNCPMPFNLCIISQGVPCGTLYPNPFIPREAIVYTDENGYYSYSGWQSGNTMVSVLMDNGISYIANDNDGAFPEIFTRNLAGSNLIVNLNINYSEPARILHNLYKAYNWCSSKLGWTRSKVKVNYYHGTNGLASFDYGDDYIDYYERYGLSNEIWFRRGRSVTAHEYGHAVMFKAYGDQLPTGDGPSPHYINCVSSPGFALCEGWAEFFSQAVFITEAVNEYGLDYLHLESLSEQAGWYGCPYWQGQNCNNDNGEVVEGAVATFLWDLYDSPATMDPSLGIDDDDAPDLTFNMWNSFLNGTLSNILGQKFHAQSIYQFWCLWNDVNPGANIFIFDHAPGPQSVDDIYDYDLFGVSPLPIAPTNLDATALSSPYIQIDLDWTDNSNNESGFKIDRRRFIGEWMEIASVDPDVTFYSDENLSGNTTYCYRVRAYNAFGSSNASNSDCATTGSYPPSGCPFVYVWNGLEFEQDNTILAASELYPEKSVTDYYKLSIPLASFNDQYKLQLREFENEVSYFDRLRLITVDHSPDVKIAVTPAGKIFAYDKELEPVSCVDQNGVDRLYEVKNKDGVYFFSEAPGYLITIYKLRTLTPNVLYDPPPPDTGYQELGGPPPVPGEKKAGIVSRVSVEIQDINGEWHDLGEVAPRYYPERVACILDASNVQLGDEVKVKTSWDRYYAADVLKYFVLSEEKPVKVWYSPVSAVNSENGEVLKRIFNTDGEFATLMPGQTIELSFPTASTLKPGMVRDFVLQTTGYYVSLSKPTTIPKTYALLNNYPNPFNITTIILYNLPKDSDVKLEVYNVLGQKVRTLAHEHQTAGHKRVVWDGTNDRGQTVSSGIYFYKLVTDDFSDSKKMILMK